MLKRELMMLRIANSELERVVERDTLTPLYNRRYFINAVNDRLKRLGRYGTRSILVFADVDGLKRISDTHGHNAGDYARSEEHTSELQSLMRTSYAVFCLKKKKT